MTATDTKGVSAATCQTSGEYSLC